MSFTDQLEDVVVVDEATDEAVMCEPHSVDCDQEADAWWIVSCCDKRYPFCWAHELQAEIELTSRRFTCLYCNADYTQVTWVRVPIVKG